NREDVIATDEHVQLADGELAVFQLDRTHDCEHAVTVLLHLRTLVAMQRVFDCQLVQTEFEPHFFELFRSRIAERDPYEPTQLVEMEMNLFLRDRGELSAVFVDDATDQHSAMIPRR